MQKFVGIGFVFELLETEFIAVRIVNSTPRAARATVPGVPTAQCRLARCRRCRLTYFFDQEEEVEVEILLSGN